MKLVDNQSQAAHALKVSVAEVRRAKRLGCSAFRANKQIDLEELSVWLSANPAETVKGETLEEAEARLMKAKADKEEFGLAVRRRQYIAMTEARRVFSRSVLTAKSKLLSIPSALAPRLALTTDASECENVLKAAIADALEGVSSGEWVDAPGNANARGGA